MEFFYCKKSPLASLINKRNVPSSGANNNYPEVHQETVDVIASDENWGAINVSYLKELQ